MREVRISYTKKIEEREVKLRKETKLICHENESVSHELTDFRQKWQISRNFIVI